MQIRNGLVSMSMMILGANSLVQSILPSILFDTPQEFFDDATGQIEVGPCHAAVSHDSLTHS